MKQLTITDNETWIMTLRVSDLQLESDLADSIRNSCNVSYGGCSAHIAQVYPETRFPNGLAVQGSLLPSGLRRGMDHSSSCWMPEQDVEQQSLFQGVGSESGIRTQSYR